MKVYEIVSEAAVLQRVPKLGADAIINVVKQRLSGKIASVVAKSIPVVGTVIALKGAYDKLKSVWQSGQSISQGDIIGAGLDVASTFGSFVTTIPATAYSMARELYAEAYAGIKGEAVTLEQDLASDPQGTKQRLNTLVASIADTIKKEVDLAMAKVRGTPQTPPTAVAQAPAARPAAPAAAPVAQAPAPKPVARV